MPVAPRRKTSAGHTLPHAPPVATTDLSSSFAFSRRFTCTDPHRPLPRLTRLPAFETLGRLARRGWTQVAGEGHLDRFRSGRS